MFVHHKQKSILDCGLTCSKTILSYYNINIDNIDQCFDVYNDQGMSLFDLEQLFNEFGVELESYEVEDIKALTNINRPFIMLVDKGGYSHYVVVCSINNNIFKISDPAKSDFTYSHLNNVKDMLQNPGVICTVDFV